MVGGGGTRAAGRAAARRPGAAVPAREAAEHVVVRLRRSSRVLLLPAAAFVAVCGVTGYWWGRLGGWLNAALPIVAGIVVVGLCLVPLLLWLNRVTIITTRRLIVQHGFVVRERREIVLSRGSEVTLRRGPLQLLAGSGNVVVRSGDHGELVLHDMPRARLVHRAVADLVEHAAVPTATGASRH